MTLLKADFHIHTSEDPEDLVRYSATELVDMAQERGYGVLAITNHNFNVWSQWLADYARERGIVLVPGMEATIQGRHVLLLNFRFGEMSVGTLHDLYRYKDSNNLIIAPHPCYPGTVALRRLFFKHLSLFDAVEVSHFWCRQINFNRKAIETARLNKIPLVGTSDAHQRRQFGTTWSEVEAEPDLDSVIGAVKKGQVVYHTSPLPVSALMHINVVMLWRNHVIQRFARPGTR